MPALTEADTIRILVATDSHVGYNERDPIRGDDSWQSFHEVMYLAKERDVDMVLLAGDLFHENKPSRKSMYQVMRSLRMNCYGEKPCELEMLSDGSETFAGAFNHVNYEDPDINVAIPVFSIHGNHDDPSGEGHLAALDLLQISGLVNYYGRTPESDNILIKPVLLQKGNTKLALYGMSNVRDERLFRTFRDGNVKFFQPSTQKGDWFNLMSVHQNNHAYTETGYLPETFLPSFLDLVVWGHEHECLIDPRKNPETGFSVMQPGSSVATSLMPGEAVPKHVAIVSVVGKDFDTETIRLKTVRPFVMKEIVLQDDKHMREVVKKDNNRSEITRHLIAVVEDLIKEAQAGWLEAQQADSRESEEDVEPPLPLVRLRVEYTAPDGGRFDCENPQRFSNRFVGKVANVNDVIQFYRKKASATRKSKNGEAEMPEESVMAQMSIDSVKVEKLVREFLTAQSLTILPQNSFGDAVSQFVNKDDKHAMEMFVNESLSTQIGNLLQQDGGDEDDMVTAMEDYKAKLEELFAQGHLRRIDKKRLKPQPEEWDPDIDGRWEDDEASRIRSDDESMANVDEDGDLGSIPTKATGAKGRGKATATTRKPAAKKPAAKATGRGKKKAVSESESEEDDDDENDVMIIDDDEDEELFVQPATKTKKAPAKRSVSPVKKTPAKKATGTQSRLNFGSSQAAPKANGRAAARALPPRRLQEPSEDEISDDDAFEPPPPTAKSTRSRR